jgi:hypothetical protein
LREKRILINLRLRLNCFFRLMIVGLIVHFALFGLAPLLRYRMLNAFPFYDNGSV